MYCVMIIFAVVQLYIYMNYDSVMRKCANNEAE